MAVDFVVIIKVNQTTQEDLAPEPPTHTDVNEGRVLSNVDAPGRDTMTPIWKKESFKILSQHLCCDSLATEVTTDLWHNTVDHLGCKIIL